MGRALQQDEALWRQLGGDYNSASDDDYVESSIEEDQVDSDFDLPECEPKRRPRTGRKKVPTATAKPDATDKHKSVLEVPLTQEQSTTTTRHKRAKMSKQNHSS